MKHEKSLTPILVASVALAFAATVVLIPSAHSIANGDLPNNSETAADVLEDSETVANVLTEDTLTVVQGEEAPAVPMHLPEAEDDVIYLPTENGLRATTIDPFLQTHLQRYLAHYHLPIAAVVVADVRTGSILAMAQGQDPSTWGGKTHTALHNGFPAASLFKTVVTAAAFEVAGVDPLNPIGLSGGCANVRPTGVWLKEKVPGRRNSMTLRRAFGHSCNGFFAKLAVNRLGLSIITKFARKFGWETGVPTDFRIKKSPILAPSAKSASAHTVGRFAAGFGFVGISAVHAAHMMMTVANEGRSIPLRLFQDTPAPESNADGKRIFSRDTSRQILGIMDATVKGGTATFAFRRGKYRKLRHMVGGKTGTLTGKSPRGLTTWFAGLAPLDHPEVVVASVVMLEDRWYIKAPNLAAEALWAYYDLNINQRLSVLSHNLPVGKHANSMPMH